MACAVAIARKTRRAGPVVSWWMLYQPHVPFLWSQLPDATISNADLRVFAKAEAPKRLVEAGGSRKQIIE